MSSWPAWRGEGCQTAGPSPSPVPRSGSPRYRYVAKGGLCPPPPLTSWVRIFFFGPDMGLGVCRVHTSNRRRAAPPPHDGSRPHSRTSCDLNLISIYLCIYLIRSHTFSTSACFVYIGSAACRIMERAQHTYYPFSTAGGGESSRLWPFPVKDFSK